MVLFNPISRLLEYVQATVARIVIFGILAVLGWGVFRAPDAIEQAATGGVDLRALVDLTVGAPSAWLAALSAAAAAVVWPAFFPDNESARRRRREEDLDDSGGAIGSLLGSAFRHRTGIAGRHGGTGNALGRLISRGSFDLPNPFSIAYRVARYVVHSAVRFWVFLAAALSGLAWYERPEAFRAAIDGGIDVVALLSAGLGAPSLLPAVGGVVLAALAWPVLFRGGSGRSSSGGAGFGEDGGE